VRARVYLNEERTKLNAERSQQKRGKIEEGVVSERVE
jgi:hypothetical protein